MSVCFVATFLRDDFNAFIAVGVVGDRVKPYYISVAGICKASHILAFLQSILDEP